MNKIESVLMNNIRHIRMLDGGIFFHRKKIPYRENPKEIYMNYTYLLECSDKTFYTGWTNDLEKRLAAHNAGRGAKYTKGRLPVLIVYYEEFATKQEAMKREAAIKRLTRIQKQELIRQWNTLLDNDTNCRP